MTLFVKRETGANVLDIMKRGPPAIDEMNAPGGLLRSYQNDRYGLRLRLVVDDTYYIHRAIGLVSENIVLGGGLAVLVLLLFLRSIAADADHRGRHPHLRHRHVRRDGSGRRNLNVISLAGPEFAVGMVVDNAIVVLENIDRHLGLGERPPGGLPRHEGGLGRHPLLDPDHRRRVRPRADHQGRDRPAVLRHRPGHLRVGGLSLVVSVTVVPMAGAKFLRHRHGARGPLAAACIRCSGWPAHRVGQRRLRPTDPRDDLPQPGRGAGSAWSSSP